MKVFLTKDYKKDIMKIFPCWLDHYLLLGNISFVEVSGLTQASETVFLFSLEMKTAIWIFKIRGYCTQCVLIFIFMITGYKYVG